MATGTKRGYRILPQISGFTLIELVMVMVLAGILSVVALPRLFDKTFKEHGFHDAVQSALQHARHVAVASRRFVCVEVKTVAGVIALKRIETSPEDLEKTTSIDCNKATDLAFPSPGRDCAATNQMCAPDGVYINSASTPQLIFDPLGRLVSAPGLVTASVASILINNQAKITVIPETGYVE